MYRDTNDVVSHVTRHTVPKDFLAMTYIWFPHNENALNDQFSPLSHMAIKELWYICIHIHNTYIAVWTTVVFTPSTRCCQSAQGDNRTLYSSTTYSVYPSLVGCIILILLDSFRDNSSENPPALSEFKGYGGKNQKLQLQHHIYIPICLPLKSLSSSTSLKYFWVEESRTWVL